MSGCPERLFFPRARAKGSCCVGLPLGPSCLSRGGCRRGAVAMPPYSRCIDNLDFHQDFFCFGNLTIVKNLRRSRNSQKTLISSRRLEHSAWNFAALHFGFKKIPLKLKNNTFSQMRGFRVFCFPRTYSRNCQTTKSFLNYQKTR